MSKLLCNALKISGGGEMPQMPSHGCAPGAARMLLLSDEMMSCAAGTNGCLDLRRRPFALGGQVNAEWNRCPGSMSRRAIEAIWILCDAAHLEHSSLLIWNTFPVQNEHHKLSTANLGRLLPKEITEQ